MAGAFSRNKSKWQQINKRGSLYSILMNLKKNRVASSLNSLVSCEYVARLYRESLQEFTKPTIILYFVSFISPFLSSVIHFSFPNYPRSWSPWIVYSDFVHSGVPEGRPSSEVWRHFARLTRWRPAACHDQTVAWQSSPSSSIDRGAARLVVWGPTRLSSITSWRPPLPSGVAGLLAPPACSMDVNHGRLDWRQARCLGAKVVSINSPTSSAAFPSQSFRSWTSFLPWMRIAHHCLWRTLNGSDDRCY